MSYKRALCMIGCLLHLNTYTMNSRQGSAEDSCINSCNERSSTIASMLKTASKYPFVHLVKNIQKEFDDKKNQHWFLDFAEQALGIMQQYHEETDRAKKSRPSIFRTLKEIRTAYWCEYKVSAEHDENQRRKREYFAQKKSHEQ